MAELSLEAVPGPVIDADEPVPATHKERKQWRESKMLKGIAVIAVLSAAGWGISEWKKVTDRNDAKYHRDHAAALAQKTAAAQPPFNAIIAQLTDESLPGRITITQRPEYINGDGEDGSIFYEGSFKIILGLCHKNYSFTSEPHVEGGSRVLGSNGEDPFAISDDNGVIGTKPLTEKTLLETFPPECATTPEETAALQPAAS